MFGVGLSEMAVIAFIAVLVFGPDRLPELAQQAGRFLRRMRGYANAARDDIRRELGPEYAELVNIIGLAMKLNLTTRQLKSMTAAYPTVGSDLGSML